MRWITPLLFLGAAAYVWHYNQTHADSKLLFPFLQVFYDGTMAQLGTMSAALFGLLGVLFTLSAIRGAWKNRRVRPDDG